MATIPSDLLPTPSTCAVQDASILRVSQGGETLQIHAPDAAVKPRVWVLTWENSYGAVGDAVRRHYRENPFGTWMFTVPKTAEVVTVYWLTPPSISWASAVSASMTGELEEALAHE